MGIDQYAKGNVLYSQEKGLGHSCYTLWVASLDLARYAYTSFRLRTEQSHGAHEDLVMSCHQMAELRTESQDLLVVTKSLSPRMAVSSPMGHELLMSVQFSENK